MALLVAGGAAENPAEEAPNGTGAHGGSSNGTGAGAVRGAGQSAAASAGATAEPTRSAAVIDAEVLTLPYPLPE